MSLFPLLAQAPGPDIGIYAPLIAAIVAMVGTYTFFVKRMTDAHFENLEGMKLRIRALEDEQDDFIAEQATLKTKLEIAEQTTAAQKTTYDRRIAELQDVARNQKREYDQRIDALEKTVDSKSSENATLQQQIDKLKEELADLTTRYGQVQEDRDRYKTQLEAETTSRERIETELRENHALIAGMKREIKQLQERAGIVEHNGDDNDPTPAAEDEKKAAATTPEPNLS